VGLLAVGVAALIAGGIWGGRYYLHSKDHVSTDDAFVTGNLVNVSPVVSGTLVKLTVAEGNSVKKGQLIARLDDSKERAALAQAKAAYEAALRGVPQAEANLRYQEQATAAAIQRARAAEEAQRARTRGASAQVTLSARTTDSQVRQAEAQVRAAQAQAQQSLAQVHAAEESVNSARRSVNTAEKGVAVLRARVPAAEADVRKAANDEERYSKLLAQEAVTKQQYDSVHAQAENARAALDSLNAQIAQAESQVNQARGSVTQAEAQLAAARKAAGASAEQVRVAQAGIGVAQAGGAQVAVQNRNFEATQAQEPQAEADIAAAQANQQQITLRQEQVSAAKAQVEQARAAVVAAQVALDDTFVYAPADGTVVKKAVNVGAALSPGQTILTMTQGNTVWVTANFKETQIGGVRIGQPVHVEVDALKGHTFHGVVASINQATGATTSLLPPDNATGNFTKVVQRIPVRIALVPDSGGKEAAGAAEIALLRQGMSVVAEIETKDAMAHPDRVPADYDGARETITVSDARASANAALSRGEIKE
jgi:membrane fusion protein (multidrug efflux system)